MTGVKVSLIVPPSLCPWAAPSFRARCSRSFSRCTASPRASRSWWPRWRTTTVKTNQPGRKKTAAASKSLCRSVWGIFWGAMRRTELLWQHWKSFPGLVTSSRRALYSGRDEPSSSSGTCFKMLTMVFFPHFFVFRGRINLTCAGFFFTLKLGILATFKSFKALRFSIK